MLISTCFLVFPSYLMDQLVALRPCQPETLIRVHPLPSPSPSMTWYSAQLH